MKGCRNLARRTVISNLPVAFKFPYKVQRRNYAMYGIEYVPCIEQGSV